MQRSSAPNWLDRAGGLAPFIALPTAMAGVGLWRRSHALRAAERRRLELEAVLQQARAALAEQDAYARKLQLSEAKLRSMVANSSDAYIALEADGTVAAWNRQAQVLFGWAEQEVLGCELAELIIPPEHRAAHREGLTRYLQEGVGPVLGQVVQLDGVRRDGRRVALEFSIWTSDGDEVLFHAFLRDVSGRLQAEAELRRSNEMLEEFAGVVAHDLRNPLAAVTGFASFISEQAETASGTEISAWAERILGAAERGGHLIDDLLTYSRFGNAALDAVPCDLSALVAGVLDAEIEAASRPVEVELHDLPLVVGDPPLLRQLLVNLIGNAIKYVPAETALTLSIDCVEGAHPGRCVLRIADNGVGVPPQDRERLFEMFQRGSYSAHLKGTGVGLAICRRVAERHGGSIWVEDATSGGARFCVELARLESGALRGREWNPTPKG